MIPLHKISGYLQEGLVKFINSGHATFYDERDKFNEEITKFIEE